jgi:multiple sugar transport system substrate-binding protein
MRRRDFIRTVAGTSAVAGLAAACGKSSTASTSTGSSASASSGASASGGAAAVTGTVNVSFDKFGASTIQADFLAATAKQFEAKYPNAKISLQPIVAAENDYYTKLELAMRSPRTSPDVVYEDTFLINADIAAGYLTALDDNLANWADWSQFKPTAKTAAQGLDGKTYGIPDGTDTRALWYNKKLLAKAGIAVPWQPKSWADILSAAKTIKSKLPGVVPFNIYSGTGVGEGCPCQGFEMLLYGTDGGTLFDKTSKKWVVGSKQIEDSFEFYENFWKGDLGPTPEQALSSSWANTVSQQLIPKSQIAIDLDGSWLSGNWLKTGAAPWAEWSETMGQAYMPTQNGQGAGKISVSGGWTWAIPKNSQNPTAAWAFIQMLTSKAGELTFDVNNVQIPVRTDVASDPTYVKANPTNTFFSGLVADTVYRPAYTAYPSVSLVIQQATEKIMTNSATAAQAAAMFTQGVTQAVTSAQVTTA